MYRKNEIIHTHPLVGWDISTVDPYDAMMIRLHYVNSPDQATADAEVDRTLSKNYTFVSINNLQRPSCSYVMPAPMA